jgi:hypothetical protein
MNTSTRITGISRLPRTVVSCASLFSRAKQAITVTTLAMTMVHTIEKVTARCLESMSGPGTSPSR